MSAQIQQRILQAAQESFQKYGYTGTTMNIVSQSAGISLATLYRYFRNKQALYQATGIDSTGSGWENPRRRAILDAALEVFSCQGYQATTMTEVAAQAGVARATLYAQFPSKEALLHELLQDNPIIGLIDQLTRQAENEQIDDPQEKLIYLSCAFVEYIHDPRRVSLLQLILSEGVRFPELQTSYHTIYESGVQLLSRYLSVILPKLDDPLFAANLLTGALLSFVLNQQVIPGSNLPVYSTEVIARRSVQYLLQGVQNADPVAE